MKPNSDAEFALVGDIYDAALEPSRWGRVLQQLAALAECNSAIVTALDHLNPAYTLAFTHNIPEPALRAYREAGLDAFEMEFHGRPLIERGPGSVLLSTEVYGSQEEYVRRGGEFYRRCLKPSNIHYLGGCLIDHGDFRWGALGIHRPEDWPALTQEHRDLLGRLGPHVRRALQIHRQISLTQQQNAALYALLGTMRVGVILLDIGGRVVFANPAAEALLRRQRLLQITPGGLQCTDPAQHRQLQQFIRGAIDTSQRDCHGNTGGVMGLVDPSRRLPLMLSVLPLSSVEAWQDLRSDNIGAALFLTDPEQGCRVSEKLLRENYGLSPREIEICQRFVNNPALATLAPELNLALISLRTFLKSIYEKTGQHSQAELMRLLMGLALDFQHIR